MQEEGDNITLVSVKFCNCYCNNFKRFLQICLLKHLMEHFNFFTLMHKMHE